MTEIQELDAQLARVARLLIAEPDLTPLRAEKVSGWSIAEQLHHVILAVDLSLGRLSGKLEPLERGITLVGRVLLKFGRFPRGVGKSPKSVLPEKRSRSELANAVEEVRARLRGLAVQADIWRCQHAVLPHPRFGGLTPRQSLRMLAVHTDHHLRIIADIRRAAGR